jgi:hypothetical protein
MNKLQKTMLMALTTVTVVLAVLVISSVLDRRDTAHDQIVAAAEDMGCTLIEQSYYHPENFYVDCGDGNIQIITLGVE